jgi:beta-glucosidase
MSKKLFPKDFLWGASTAAHQVEGNTENQWSVWEHANSAKLAINAKKQLEYLNRYGRHLLWEEVAEKASQPENYISGKAVEHFARYKEDFSILKSLNMNAYRFSIEWSRLEPKKGVWDREAIAHYHRYIAELKKHGIEPLLTIWHWTMPTWFTGLGGFTKKANLTYFDDFVRKISEEFGNEVDYIFILNEPNVYTVMGYVIGVWPPDKKNIFSALGVYLNLVSTHKRAYRILKTNRADLKVGIAMNLSQSFAVNPKNPISRFSVRAQEYVWNWWFLNRVKSNLDFIGINFYTTNHYNWRLKLQNPKEPVSDVGWYMEPGALFDLLSETDRRYHLPIIITENGLADAGDKQRKWWIEQTITAMGKALSLGVNLTGYLHWSLLDNFEWAYGWWPKFGLVNVDRTTMKRSVRPSAKWFAQEIKRLS